MSIRQLEAINSRLLTNMQTVTTTAAGPGGAVLPDAGEFVYIDIDDTVRQTYG